MIQIPLEFVTLSVQNIEIEDMQTLRFYEKAGFNRNDKIAFVQWL